MSGLPLKQGNNEALGQKENSVGGRCSDTSQELERSLSALLLARFGRLTSNLGTKAAEIPSLKTD